MGSDRIIRVSCAVITENGKLLAARRSAKMEQPMKWELPGGKIEKGESVFEAVAREIREELGLTVKPERELESVIHSYPEKTIELIPVAVKVVSGTLKVAEHHDTAWVDLSGAKSLDWACADRKLLEKNSFFDEKKKGVTFKP